MTTLDELVRAIVREELDQGRPQAQPQPVAYSVVEVAELLSCSRRHVYEHLIGTGRLSTLKVGRRVLVPAADIRRLMDEAE